MRVGKGHCKKWLNDWVGNKGLTVSVVRGKNSTVASPSTEQPSATTGFLRMMKRPQLLVGEGWAGLEGSVSLLSSSHLSLWEQTFIKQP